MLQKKRNNFTLFLVIGLVILLTGVFMFILMGQPRVSWSQTYLPEDKNPYGTNILFALLKETRGQQPFIMIKDSAHKELPADPTTKTDTYLYIGESYYGDSTDVARLLEFVSNGNNAFLLCSNASNLVFDSLIRAPINTETEYYEGDPEGYAIDDFDEQKVYNVSDSTIAVYLQETHEKASGFDLSYRYYYEIMLNEWPYFKDGLVTYSGEPCEVLGSFDEEYHNYLRISYGQGSIYFHSTPLVFTNYYMLNDTAMNYCREALSYIGNGNVYWDEDNRTYDYKSMQHQGESGSNPSKPGEGPLEFILSEPNLRIAWYLLLLSGILYLFFGAKRKQKIIKTLDKMENSSIEYAEVLSQMFMKQKDHKKLVLMKMELYKSHLRDRFNIKLPTRMGDENDALYTDISTKSAVPFHLIKEIFELHKFNASIVDVSTEDMLVFHQKLEEFYLTCK